MLDRMRRHRGWLKWSLAIVVLTFILLYIPSFLTQEGVGAAPTDTIATVDGQKVMVGAFQRAYQQQLTSLRQAYGGQLDEQMIRQLGLAQQIVQRLVDDAAVLAEARRLGITVTDAELRERIIRIPGFQENGQFIGNARYRQILQMQRPPMRFEEFEEEMRRQIVSEKLQAAVTAWVHASDAEADEEYRRRNEKVKLDLAVFTSSQFRSAVQPTDTDLQAQFTANPETYRMPEKRRVRYLSVDADALRATMTVTPQEIDARYRQNIQTYSTPEQVRASHILLKTEGKDEAAVQKQAEAVLAKVKAGADFAALAKQYSEDGSKDVGGDLDFFGRNAMVKEFEDAAWALQPGQVTDLVKSPFGFHIIKLTDKRAASTRTLDEVRPEITDQIKYEKAQAEAQKIAAEIEKEIDDPTDLDRVARERSLAVGDSGLFSRDEPLAGLGFAPAVSAEAFSLEQGKVSGMLRTTQGFAWISLAEIKPSYLPAIDEVKDKVREDVIRLKAVELAKTRAATMAQAAGRGSFAAAAKSAGVEVKTTELITRGTALPEVGINATVDDAVFALKAGQTSAPIATDTAVVVARVTERQDIDPAAMATGREGVRTELSDQRRGQFFAAYMTKAKEKMNMQFNEATLRNILGNQ